LLEKEEEEKRKQELRIIKEIKEKVRRITPSPIVILKKEEEEKDVS
jgi:hypothetical protein